MKKFLIEESEKSRILEMHKLIKEQPQQNGQTTTQSDLDKLKIALKTCIKKYTWFTPDSASPLRKTKSGKDIIVGTGSNGNTYYFYADLTVVNAATGAKRNWECDFTPPSQPEKPKVRTAEQKDVIEFFKGKNFYEMDPKPSQVQIEDGNILALDLTGAKNDVSKYPGLSEFLPLVEKYKSYFPVADFKNGFFLYKKAEKSNAPTAGKKVEVTAESCKTAIEDLYNNMRSPNTYPLGNEQIVDHIKLTRMCAEPANREKFLLRFGLKAKLKDISKRYGINL